MLRSMKKGLFCGLLLSSILSSGVSVLFTNPVHAQQENVQQLSHPQQQEEPFAKWGTKAVEAVKQKFPDSNLSDYEYLGTNSTNVNEWQDNFHIVVSKGGKKKLVRATVSYDSKAQQLKNVTIKEEKCD
jgi:hypothetical protein